MKIKQYGLAVFVSMVSGFGWANSEGVAKKLHERVAGVPPTEVMWAAMSKKVAEGDLVGAAYLATENENFYGTVLKNWAMPWSNEAQTVFEPLNDFVATIIGLVRDDEDFRQVLYGDILYIADTTKDRFINDYSPRVTRNTHYTRAELSNIPLKDLLIRVKQSDHTTLTPEQAAGVMTSKKAASEFFLDGTNRAMLRFTSMAFLCKDMEELNDVTRPVDRVRQDVDRSPAGETEQYLIRCAGCHSGLDALAGAFSYNDLGLKGGQFNTYQSREVANQGVVVDKYLINAHVFPNGYVTKDDSWVNYWREGRNASLGWDQSLPGKGNGAKSLGMELAHSEQFSRCQVEKSFELTCMGPPRSGTDKVAVERIMGVFKDSGYNLKTVIAETAAYCAQ